MREYGQIQSAFWQNEDIIGCSDGAKLLACYLMTGPHTNGVGCFVLPDGYILEDHPSWSKAQVTERFAELFRNGFAYRHERVVYLPNFLKWNTIANSNIARARFLDWTAVPRGLMRQCAAVSMLTFSDWWREADKQVLIEEKAFLNNEVGNGLANGLANGSLNGLRNGLANLFLSFKNQHPTPPHPIQERETDVSLVRNVKKARTSPKADANLSTDFLTFWHAYPRKEQRAKAAQAFAKLAPDPALLQTMLAALNAQAATEKWRYEPQYIPHPTSWLNGRRWDDELTALHPPPKPAAPSKTRQGIDTLMRGVKHHDAANRLARSTDPTRPEQALLPEPGADPGG
jgi:hypothetical protein